MDFLYDLGLFLAQAVIIVAAILAVIITVIAVNSKPKAEKGELLITNLTEELKELDHHLKQELLTKKQFKALEKQKKAADKAAEKAAETSDEQPKRVFVIDFHGSVDAHEVSSLREEISAVLTIADKDKDEVIINVESGGGYVHGYGFAASQLKRLRDAEIPLTICVDKVAASGGYMMACVANTIYAAPFAIIGSIGVIAQIPNFNRVLKKYDIDYEQHTAGDFKRTLTMFGENTEAGREKFREELEQTHGLFKTFVNEFRPALDMAKVATGEHWYGQQAVELGLVDGISTSDDLIRRHCLEHEVIKISYQRKKKLAERLGHGASAVIDAVMTKLTAKDHQPL